MTKKLFLFPFFILFGTINLFTQSLLNTKIQFQADNLSIEDALLQLSEKANCSISFNSSYFKEDQRITIPPQQQTLKKLLEQCLKNSGYIFKVENNGIRLYPLPPPIYTISGFVEDSLSGERLVAATVYDQRSGKGTITNEYGFYSLSIPQGEATLTFSYLGFTSREYQFSIRKNFQLTVGLNSSITLGEIIVIDSKTPITSDVGKAIAPNYQSTFFNSIPTLGGEQDVLQYFQTLAGVQSGSDGFGGMQVRGGDTNQNLVLLDGVPVYNPTHTFGLFSIFNANTIKSATLHKGHFPARFSGRLSSVIDIRTREGNIKEFKGGLNISLLATSLFAEGPIVKDKTGFLISLRRTHIDPIINSISQAERGSEFETQTGYYFYDTNIKLHHQFTEKDRLYLSFYNGRDNISDDIELEEEEKEIWQEEPESKYLNYNWGNTILALRWNHLWNARLFSNTTLTYSEFGFENRYAEEFSTEEESFIILYDFSSNINDTGIKIDFDFLPSTQHHFRFGTGILVREFRPSLISDRFIQEDAFDIENDDLEKTFTFLDPNFIATELNVYAEDEWAISPKWKAQLGVHATVFIAPNKIYPTLQPRLSLYYRPLPKLKLSASINHLQQYLHVLESNIADIPNDLWVPSTAKVRPQSAWQTDLGINCLWKKDIAWSVEGYYKKLNHLVSYQENTDFLLEEEEELSFDWENEVTIGKGWAYGLESSLTKQTGKTTGWINYHLAWSERQFEGLNNNQKFPFRYNRRHEIKIGIGQQFTRVFNLLATWKYGTGQWKTATAFKPNQPTPFINNQQLKPYHRLDLTAQFNWSKKRLKHQLVIGINNLYGRNNESAYLVNTEDISEEWKLGGWVLPSFRYGLRF